MLLQPNQTRGIVAGDASRLQFKLGNIEPVSSAGNVAQRSISFDRIRRFYDPQFKFYGAKGESILREIRRGRFGKAGLDEFVREKDLVDAGCGRQTLIDAIVQVHEMGARNYVGIDLVMPTNPKSVMREVDTTITSNMGVLLIEAEMIAVLKAIPDKSPIVVMMNQVLSREMFFKQGINDTAELSAVLEYELARTVASGGIVFGAISTPLGPQAGVNWNANWERISGRNDALDVLVRK